MAVGGNYKPKTIYLPPRIKSRLETIFDFNYTVAEAPSGYGKTTAIKEFLNNQDKPFIWFNVDSDDQDQFFSDFCSRLYSIDKGAASKLRLEGFPFDVDRYKRIARILIDLELEEKTILVLDNYQYISSEFLNKVFKDVTAKKDSKLNILILTQEITSGFAFELIYKKQLNYISKNDFEFSIDEIEKYCKLCGVHLENQEIEYLYEYSEGWISAIYLQLLNFVNVGKFELTDSINALVVNSVWEKLKSKEKDFLISMSACEGFSLKKASTICRHILKESEIKTILEKNEFIRYDSKQREYHIHALLKFFLKEEFEKSDPNFKKTTFMKIAEWHSLNGEYFTSILYYYDIKEYEAILGMNYNVGDLLSNANKNNKHIFMNIVAEVSNDLKEKYAGNYLMYLIALFLYNERSLLLTECETLDGLIKNSKNISEKDKKYLFGDLKIVEAACLFNDVKKMGNCVIEAEQFLKGPSKIFYNYCSLLFGCPSALPLYHKTPGNLNSVMDNIDEYIPYMYRLSGGQGKGTEALMRAQALFYRGDMGSAEILAHKAVYMAETRTQVTVYVGAMVLLAKIFIYNGDASAYKETIENMKNMVKESDELFKTNSLDLAFGNIGTAIEALDIVPEWLKKSETIENHCNLVTLGYANCVYGKYLILQHEYSKLLGISGQFIGVANVFSSIIYKIYTYIYISIANFKTGNTEKASKFLNEAIELANEDELYIPFVENYSRIEEILITMPKNSIFISFLKKTASMSRSFEKGRELIVKSINTDKNYGLTRREVEVAKLAASRMSNREIAEKLFIAENTVKSNMKIIFNKLGISSRNELKEYF